MTKYAVIIGASSGIGREMALRLADEGWRIAVAGRREGMLREVCALRPESLVPAVMDASDIDTLSARLDAAVRAVGGMDLLVIGAGTGELNPHLDPAPELSTVAVNVAGFTVAATWAYGYFLEKGEGHLAAITSVAALVGEGSAPAYPASKAYQSLYLDGLRKRARKEIPALAVTELRPGSVNTAMMKGEGHFWISSPEAAAEAACEAIAKKRKLRYISRRWSLVGFLLRLGALFS